MAKQSKSKTSNKELKPVIEVKEEIAKPFPTDDIVKIIFNGQEYSKSNQVARVLVENGKAKLA